MRDWSHWQFNVLPVLRRSADRSSANFNGMLSDQAVLDRRSKLDSNAESEETSCVGSWASGLLHGSRAAWLAGPPAKAVPQAGSRCTGEFPEFHHL